MSRRKVDQELVGRYGAMRRPELIRAREHADEMAEYWIKHRDAMREAQFLQDKWVKEQGELPMPSRYGEEG